MRSAIVAAALAATAIAVPLQERAVVYETATDVKMVYVTEYYTVTGDKAAPTKDAAPTHQQHWGHHPPHYWGGPHTAEDPHPTVQPAPAPQPEPTTHKAPPPPAPTTWAPAPTHSPAPAPAPAPPSGGGSPPSDYNGKVLWHHNQHRMNHTDTPALAWSSSLESTARKIAQTCVYGHNTDMDGGGYGQNIAAGVSSDEVGRVITNMFYNSEINDYVMDSNNYASNTPSGFETWGHFSQMVWVNTREVGCYTQNCPSLGNVGSNVPGWFTVCNYQPPGNVANNYHDNVKKSKGMPILDGIALYN